MKNGLLVAVIFLCLSVSSSAFAGWILVDHTTDGIRAYFDEDSVAPLPGPGLFVSAVIRFDRSAQNLSSIEQFVEIGCGDKTLTVLKARFIPQPWELNSRKISIDKGSLYDTLSTKICVGLLLKTAGDQVRKEKKGDSPP